MVKPLMSKAVAIWLIENTSLTFKQIANFCGMHSLEIEALANDEHNKNHGLSPVITGELTDEEIARCEQDPLLELQYKKESVAASKITTKSSSQSKFKKQNKPEAILWLINNYASLSNYQIAKLLGATPNVVKAIREKKHWNYINLKPRNPIALGYCTEEQVLKAIAKVKALEVDSHNEKEPSKIKASKK